MSFRTSDRALVSLSMSDLAVIEQALVRMASPDAVRCLNALRATLGHGPVVTSRELLEVWADGSSVQLRAISVAGDPVDVGASEARDFAHRILGAADTADAG